MTSKMNENNNTRHSDASTTSKAFSKAVQRTLVRTKTKMLQKVGKADKTTDERFKDHIVNFQRQQATALRFQKQLKQYISCLKEMTSATHSLHAVIQDTYELDWLDPHGVDACLKDLNLACITYESELTQRFSDICHYLDEFPTLKTKINKRRKKLLDYDNAKNEFDALSSARKPDHAKICKAQQSLNEAEKMFGDINMEMCQDLPAFYDYRIIFTANTLHDLYAAANTYHLQSVKATESLTEVLQSLITSHKEETRRMHEDEPDFCSQSNSTEDTGELSSPMLEHNINHTADLISHAKVAESTPRRTEDSEIIKHQTQRNPSFNSKPLNQNKTVNNSVNTSRETSTSSRPPDRKPLYQVVATHPYNAEDDDELTFEAGDIIQVVEFNNEDDIDEGWLMGASTSTGGRGVFPANFTQRIQKQPPR